MAEAELSEAAKAELEAGRAARERSLAEFGQRTKGKPTPTQAENDENAVELGRFCGREHEADGSDPDPGSVGKQIEAKPSGGGYTTRQAQAHARTPKTE